MRNETVRGILCQETTLVDGTAERRLHWFGHVSRMGSERLPAKALHCSYINGKRNQGRQPKKWMRCYRMDSNMQIMTGIEVISEANFPKLWEYCPHAH